MFHRRIGVLTFGYGAVVYLDEVGTQAVRAIGSDVAQPAFGGIGFSYFSGAVPLVPFANTSASMARVIAGIAIGVAGARRALFPP
jgi:hypothetical protein